MLFNPTEQADRDHINQGKTNRERYKRAKETLRLRYRVKARKYLIPQGKAYTQYIAHRHYERYTLDYGVYCYGCTHHLYEEEKERYPSIYLESYDSDYAYNPKDNNIDIEYYPSKN